MDRRHVDRGGVVLARVVVLSRGIGAVRGVGVVGVCAVHNRK